MVKHQFLGLDADAWETADQLPEWSEMTQGLVTIEDVKAGLVAMLRRLDADLGHSERKTQP